MSVNNSLFVKYRPQKFSEVVEQDAIKQILMHEIQTNNIKRCLLFTGGAGTGKCLGKGTLVMMYDGSTKEVEKIQPGEKVMGPDELPRIVYDIAKGIELLYKVTYEDGSSFVCNKSHILSVKHKDTNEIVHVNVEEYYVNKDNFWSSQYFGFKYKDENLYKIQIERLQEESFYGFSLITDPDDVVQECLEYCFVLGNGIVTHNTTTARIYANEIEPCKSNIIEINCADHTGVDDIRQLVIEPSRQKPLQGKYKVFILDENHMLTVQAQSALLKILEEPPSYCIYIMCTTDPQKVLPTILSRTFRYDFQLISYQGIVDRLNYILTTEKSLPNNCGIQSWDMDSLNYIALQSRGHLRDAITTLQKVVSFDGNITVNSVEKVLGVTSFEILFNVLDCILSKNDQLLIQQLDNLNKSGINLKLFVKNFLQFVLDVNKYLILKTETNNTSLDFTLIPPSYVGRLVNYNVSHRPILKNLLRTLLQLNSSLRWETDVKPVLETNLLMEVL